MMYNNQSVSLITTAPIKALSSIQLSAFQYKCFSNPFYWIPSIPFLRNIMVLAPIGLFTNSGASFPSIGFEFNSGLSLRSS